MARSEVRAVGDAAADREGRTVHHHKRGAPIQDTVREDAVPAGAEEG
jgi:hypothetical protein